MATWAQYLGEKRDRFVDQLLELLRIPSISTDPAYKTETRRAALWVAARLQTAGLEHVKVMETAGHPVVYGDWLHAPGQPTVLIYGHYDVQPADPLELWASPPFEPVVRDGRVYARAASDMKGNLLLTIVACEAMLRTTGALPVNVKFIFEGEEEVGSPNLVPFVAAHKELLACDLAVSADSGQYSEDQPALLVGLRGLAGLQIDVRVGSSDMHSGIMGGIAANANQVLVDILSALKAPDGKITVDGFYDDVLPLSDADREMMAHIPDDTALSVRANGLKADAGEAGFTPRERNWARPTLDINGIWGGFQGDGVKTVIPCEAHAKITCRLAHGQSPSRVIELLTAHIGRHTPLTADVSVTPVAGQAIPYLIPADHFGLKAANSALTRVYGRPPFLMRMGASVPVTAIFLQVLGVYTVSYGFSQFDEKMHAPDEFVRLSNFEKGQQAYCLLLEALAR
ncbi:MAG: peptidase dimerization domain protein [Firmicutes bacterium]|nr:peptidase dimerization domain protein [Bacillota bacterium]